MIEAARSVKLHTSPDPNVNNTAESRLDPITGEWTIFAPERDRRPDDFKVTRTVTSESAGCPFCLGHEASTPPAVWIGRLDDETDGKSCDCKSGNDDWSVRVVPNKFPAVTPIAARANESVGFERESEFFHSRPLGGGHEVIIESPHHIESLSQLDFAEAALVFKAYQERIRHWRDQPGVRYISVFKNVGGEAGASLQHAHSQLIAIDRRPRHVTNVVDRMRHHQATTGCCLQCDLIRAELKSKRRIIGQTESLVAYCPFSSRLPMMVRITSKSHQAYFEDLTAPIIDEVSRLATRVVSWIEKTRPGTAYNHLLHTCPPGVTGGEDSYHWSMEIFPRLTQVAGFEWSSQCMINPIMPELAAAKLRACAAAEDPRLVL